MFAFPVSLHWLIFVALRFLHRRQHLSSMSDFLFDSCWLMFFSYFTPFCSLCFSVFTTLCPFLLHKHVKWHQGDLFLCKKNSQDKEDFFFSCSQWWCSCSCCRDRQLQNYHPHHHQRGRSSTSKPALLVSLRGEEKRKCKPHLKFLLIHVACFLQVCVNAPAASDLWLNDPIGALYKSSRDEKKLRSQQQLFEGPDIGSHDFDHM